MKCSGSSDSEPDDVKVRPETVAKVWFSCLLKDLFSCLLFLNVKC